MKSIDIQWENVDERNGGYVPLGSSVVGFILHAGY